MVSKDLYCYVLKYNISYIIGQVLTYSLFIQLTLLSGYCVQVTVLGAQNTQET